MTAKRESNLYRLLEEVVREDKRWLEDYLSAKRIRPTSMDPAGIMQDVRFSIRDDSKEQLLWKLFRDAWRQRRATFKKRSTNRVTHTITISAEAEIYLRSKCGRDDKTISQVINELLLQKSRIKKKRDAESSLFNGFQRQTT